MRRRSHDHKPREKTDNKSGPTRNPKNRDIRPKLQNVREMFKESKVKNCQYPSGKQSIEFIPVVCTLVYSVKAADTKGQI